MKKFRMFMMFAMLVLLLTGCGQTQEEKIAEVQAANAITTADVVELLEYRDLTVEKQTPSDAWMEQWPDIEIYKINGEGLLLMQATDGLHLYQRDKLVQELDWSFWGYRYDSTESAVLNQLLTDFVPETGFYAYSYAWEAKNIIACYVPYFAMELPEDGDVQTEEEQLAMVKIFDEITALSNQVKAVFMTDINDMITGSNTTVEQQNFALDVSVDYYQVPFEVDGNTTYDVYYDLEAAVTLLDGTELQFEGQEVLGELRLIKKPAAAATKAMSVGGTFEELLADDNQMTFGIDDHFIVGPEPQEQLQFQAIIKVGDYEESFDIIVHLEHRGLSIGY